MQFSTCMLIAVRSIKLCDFANVAGEYEFAVLSVRLDNRTVNRNRDDILTCTNYVFFEFVRIFRVLVVVVIG